MSNEDVVYVPEDPAEAENFDPGYPHTHDDPGDFDGHEVHNG